MKLAIFEGGHCLHVSWCDKGLDGEGAWVGQDHAVTPKELERRLNRAKSDRTDDGWSDYEYVAVELAAQRWVAANTGAVVIRATCGFEFESVSDVKRFLAAMRAAVKSAKSEYDSGVPWPEWAKQAQAAGWKAPKGWKP